MTTCPLHDTDWRAFASDNYAGVHPEVLAAIAAANGGHQIAYLPHPPLRAAKVEAHLLGERCH